MNRLRLFIIGAILAASVAGSLFLPAAQNNAALEQGKYLVERVSM
jgi:hypothetical protein